MTVDMSAKFGKKEQAKNGLNDITHELAETPLARRLIVAVIDCPKSYVDHAQGDEETHKVRILHVEAAVTVEQEQALRAVLDGRYKSRTGNALAPELPFDGGDAPNPGQRPGPDPTDADAGVEVDDSDEDED